MAELSAEDEVVFAGHIADLAVMALGQRATTPNSPAAVSVRSLSGPVPIGRDQLIDQGRSFNENIDVDIADGAIPR